MALTQNRPRRKVTGGRYIDFRKKRSYELGRVPTFTKLSEKASRILRGRGGHQKIVLLQADTANVIGKDGKTFQAKIKTVAENPANRHFVRRNILTKGTIIDTEKGKARITNRPGQEGAINAVLI